MQRLAGCEPNRPVELSGSQSTIALWPARERTLIQVALVAVRGLITARAIGPAHASPHVLVGFPVPYGPERNILPSSSYKVNHLTLLRGDIFQKNQLIITSH
jgi:hypothetical protein